MQVEYVVMYTFFTVTAGSALMFIYFLATRHMPDFWHAFIVYNTLWSMALGTVIKHAYIKGLSDSIQKNPDITENIQ
jgi:hypothetical protein